MAEWVVSVQIRNKENIQLTAELLRSSLRVVNRAQPMLQEQATTQNTSHQRSHDALKLQ